MTNDRGEFERLTEPLILRLRELEEIHGWRYIVRSQESEFWIWTKAVVVQVRWLGANSNPQFSTFATTGETYRSEDVEAVIDVVIAEILEGEEK